MTEDDRRKFTRISLEVELTLLDGGSDVPVSGLRNISLGGAFVFTDEPPPMGSVCRAKISLIGPSSLLKIEADAEVVRVEDSGVGLDFSKIDLDSLMHLRHLVKVHSMDPETVDKEFAQNLLGLE